jgi:hypothetical protein
MNKSGIIYTSSVSDFVITEVKPAMVLNSKLGVTGSIFDDVLIKNEEIKDITADSLVFADDAGFFDDFKKDEANKQQEDQVGTTQNLTTLSVPDTAVKSKNSDTKGRVALKTIGNRKPNIKNVYKRDYVFKKPEIIISATYKEKTERTFLQKKHIDWQKDKTVEEKNTKTNVYQPSDYFESDYQNFKVSEFGKKGKVKKKAVRTNESGDFVRKGSKRKSIKQKAKESKQIKNEKVGEKKKTKREEEGSSVFLDMVSGSWDVARYIFDQEVIIRFVFALIAGVLVFGYIFVGMGLI